MDRVKGKVALITGAGTGVGRACIRRLAIGFVADVDQVDDCLPIPGSATASQTAAGTAKGCVRCERLGATFRRRAAGNSGGDRSTLNGLWSAWVR